MKRLLIDTNLLILLLVGTYKTDLIGVHKNCREFDDIDYRLLCNICQDFDEWVYLPNTLTEVSNLLRQTGEPDRSELTAHIMSLFQFGQESYVRSEDAGCHSAFRRLGVTDCALLCADEGATLLTRDLDLYLEASRSGREVINFLYYRERVSPRV